MNDNKSVVSSLSSGYTQAEVQVIASTLCAKLIVVHGVIWHESTSGVIGFEPLPTTSRLIKLMLQAKKSSPSQYRRDLDQFKHIDEEDAKIKILTSILPDWRRVTVAAHADPHDVFLGNMVGLSICNPTDTFNRRFGFKQARARLHMGEFPDGSPFPGVPLKVLLDTIRINIGRRRSATGKPSMIVVTNSEAQRIYIEGLLHDK